METIKKRTRRLASKVYPGKRRGEAVIELTRGKVALVSEQDLPRLRKHTWCYANHGYAVTRLDGRVVYLHRIILGLTDSNIQVDHINWDKLDNRRENLRTCTSSENMANKGTGGGLRSSKSGLKGVWRVPEYVHKTKHWCAMHKHKNLGYFYTPEEAARVWNAAAKETYGEFAYQNQRR